MTGMKILKMHEERRKGDGDGDGDGDGEVRS